MQRFVARHNLDHFRELVAAAETGQERQTLRQLIAEEEEKLKQAEAEQAKTKPR